MTLRFPASLLVGLGNLVFLTFMAAAPIGTMIHLAFTDPDRAWWALNYVFQFWFVSERWHAGGPEAAATAFLAWLLGLYAAWVTIMTFGTLFTTTVIMHTGVMQLRGEAASLAEGFRVAGRNAGRLLGLAFVTGALLAVVRRFSATLALVPLLGRYALRAVQAALTGVLYVSLPVLVYERKGAWSAVSETWRHVRRTWGGLVVGTGLTMSALWVGLWIVEYALLASFEAWFGVQLLDWGGLLLLQLATAVLLYCANVALSANLRAALYLHVTEGHTGVLPRHAVVTDAAFDAPREPSAIPSVRR